MAIAAFNRLIIMIIAASMCQLGHSAEDEQNSTIIGPSNPDLQEGANQLLAGNAKEGVRLTLLGLNLTANRRDKVTALSNLCAGYILLEQYETALDYCNQAIDVNEQHWRAYNNRALAYLKLKRFEEAKRDVIKGQEINERARTLKVVRGMVLDETDPVAEHIVIDERRRPVPANEGD